MRGTTEHRPPPAAVIGCCRRAPHVPPRPGRDRVRLVEEASRDALDEPEPAYGEWLPRRVRTNEAPARLRSATVTLRKVGAAPWARRADEAIRTARGPAPRTSPACCRPLV